MNFNLNGLTEAQKKLVESAVKDGRITATEAEQLEAAGLNAKIIAELQGKYPDTGEIPNGEPEMENSQNSALSYMVGGAIVGGVLGFVIGGPAGAAMGAILLGGAPLATGCTPIEINPNQSVDITIENPDYSEELKALLNELKALKKEINEMKEQDKVQHEELMKKLQALVVMMQEQGHGIDKIISELKNLNVGMGDIINLIKTNNYTTEQILEAIKTNDDGTNALLKEILDEVRVGNELNTKQTYLLNGIYNKLSALLANGHKDGEEIKLLLVKMLEMLKADITQDHELNEKTHELLHTIIEKMDGLSGNVMKVLEAILANQKNMTEDFMADLKTIIENQDEQGAKMDSIRELLVKNNEISQGIEDAVKYLGEQNNANHKTIIELLKQLNEKSNNGTVTDLSEVTALLKEIKTNTAGDWETSLRIEDKLNILGQTLNVILQTQKDMGEDTKAVLLKILAKIPDGCNCEPLDITVLVKMLEIIIEKMDDIKSNPKHEGILDDLDGVLG